jgi:hypothetical protein
MHKILTILAIIIIVVIIIYYSKYYNFNSNFYELYEPNMDDNYLDEFVKMYPLEIDCPYRGNKMVKVHHPKTCG